MKIFRVNRAMNVFKVTIWFVLCFLIVSISLSCKPKLSEDGILKLQQDQYNALMGKFALSTNLSKFVLAEGERAPSGRSRNVTTVFMKKKPNGQPIFACRIFMGKLQILNSSSSKWENMVVNNYPIEVKDPGSEFILPPNRNGIIINLTLVYVFKGKTYAFPVMGAKFICKNK